jgi:hypothetical protein
MNKTEKKLYVLMFFLLALIAGVKEHRKAEFDHSIKHFSLPSNRYKDLVKNIEAHREFSINQHGN